MYLKKILFILFVAVTTNAQAINEHIDSLENITIFTKAKLYYNKGLAFGRTGKLDSASYYTQNAVDLYENATIINSTLLAYSYQNLGIINKLLGKYNDAITCYNKAEEIYLLNNNSLLLAYIYGNKANIFRGQQDYNKAEDYFFRSLNIFSKDTTRNKNQLASTFNNIGFNYMNKKEYRNATNYFFRSLKLKKKSTSYTTYGNLAICFEKQEELIKANNCYLRAISISENNYGSHNIITAKQILNYGQFILNNPLFGIKAIDLFNQASQIYIENLGKVHPDLSMCYNNIGEFHLKNKQLDSALFYFQKSLIALSPEFNDTSLSSNPEINQVLSKTHLLSSLKNKAYALSRLGTQNTNISNYKLSLATYDRATEAINLIRSGYLSEESKLFLADNEFETFSNALQTSYELYKLTNEQKYLEKAFNYSEAGKSAILTEALKNTYALNIGGIPDSLINKEKQLEKSIWTYEELIYEENKKKNTDQNKLEYWHKYLFEKKQEFDDLAVYLENNFQKYHSLKYVQNTLKIEDIQKKLSRKDLLIEYFLTNDKIYTILIGKKESGIFVQNIDQSFHIHLDNLLQSLSNNNFSNHGFEEFKQYQESSFFIYKTLLKPIENRIINKNLILIPDGKLAYLPFEVLTTENISFKRINYKGLPYLLYSNHFNYSYSASFLFENSDITKRAGKKLGAFAPTYNNISGLPDKFSLFRQEYRERLFPLKGIKDEVQKVSELINGDLYLDFDANEKTFKKVASQYDILHLAMHTIMDDQNPMYSKMAFTQNEDSIEDGFLNTYELYNMKLYSRMAVLSSCNSGSGKLHRGEGVISLARGFIYSGCPSIVMTLWSVEDKSGVKLMTSFYENLLKGKTKSESLQKSKIDFINNADQLKAHPYFWSGYVVIGNNNALFFSYKRYVVFSGILILLTIGIMLIIRLRKTN